jgi:hypothetical protein
MPRLWYPSWEFSWEYSKVFYSQICLVEQDRI